MLRRCVYYDGRTHGWPLPENRCTYPTHDGPHSFQAVLNLDEQGHPVEDDWGYYDEEVPAVRFSLWRLIKDAINYWRSLRANP